MNYVCLKKRVQITGGSGPARFSCIGSGASMFRMSIIYPSGGIHTQQANGAAIATLLARQGRRGRVSQVAAFSSRRFSAGFMSAVRASGSSSTSSKVSRSLCAFQMSFSVLFW